MNKQNKDSLENFFKERAQNYNIEFKEGDWRKLEAQLDTEMPVTFTFWSYLKKFWPVTFFVLLIPVAWYSYYLFTNSGKTDLDLGNKNQNSLVIKERVTESFNNDQETVEDQNIFPNTEEIEGSKNNKNVTGNNNLLTEQKTTSLISSSAKGSGNVNPLMPAVVVLREESDTEEDIGNFSQHNSDRFTNNEDGLFFRKDLTNLQPVFINYDQIHERSPGEIQTVPEVINSQSNKNKISFYAGVGFSPDFSTVGLGNFIAPGFRWNFIGEIGFSRRFFINTGIIYVKNRYEAYGEDYHAPVQYWRNGIVADDAYGKCVMLDLPLNLRYSIVLRNRHQLFISGGASTYFLLKEDYYFHYEQDDPDLPKYWGTDKVSIYPFGIVNLSFGYQYQLGSKGSIQVEPFIKLPTGGIGWGNVDLHTIGVYFMYKYRIGR